jgi:hypothetical protein
MPGLRPKWVTAVPTGAPELAGSCGGIGSTSRPHGLHYGFTERECPEGRRVAALRDKQAAGLDDSDARARDEPFVTFPSC